MLRRGLLKFVDREPVAAVSLGLGFFGFSLPFIVPPIRQSLGLCTKQSSPTCELPKPRMAPGVAQSG
ncbi:unnamed protein product [Ectocarpus sp. 8 AP-2014]|uniref:Uncharacterized protein n=1 Tax=Ectocarpus siliculosus TaxID=2880 RepID=D7FZS9_ECTSI|nr:expressed unknown protein [Ectocarpus siliculosus]|eukprot:CBJ32896.1 expressed unknown protein [Ectocarpus siliculosus]